MELFLEGKRKRIRHGVTFGGLFRARARSARKKLEMMKRERMLQTCRVRAASACDRLVDAVVASELWPVSRRGRGSTPSKLLRDKESKETYKYVEVRSAARVNLAMQMFVAARFAG